MRDYEQHVIRLLAERAYQEGDLVLSSGQRSGVYLDAKQVTYHPDGVEAVGGAVLDRIRSYEVDGIGGLTMGADAIVVSTVWAARGEGIELPGFVVRKEPKRHGLRKRVEGVVPPEGSRVAIVDDVVTSGGSVLEAVDAVEELGLEVAVVVPLVDREEGGREAVAERNIPFEPVCTLSAITRARGLTGATNRG